MSWHSLKTMTLRRDQAELDPVCQLERNQIDKLVNELETIDNITKSINHSVKNLLRQMDRTGRSELNLARDLASQAKIFTYDSLMCNILEECHSFTHMDRAGNSDFIVTLQKTLIGPLRLLERAMFEIRTELKTYNSLEQRIVKVQKKVMTYNEREKTAPNLVKLQEIKLELAIRKSEFSRATQQLFVRLSKFVSSSLELLNSCVKGFITAELAWIQSSRRSIRDSLVRSASSTEVDHVKSIGNTMRALDSLSICFESRSV